MIICYLRKHEGMMLQNKKSGVLNQIKFGTRGGAKSDGKNGRGWLNQIIKVGRGRLSQMLKVGVGV